MFQMSGQPSNWDRGQPKPYGWHQMNSRSQMSRHTARSASNVQPPTPSTSWPVSSPSVALHFQQSKQHEVHRIDMEATISPSVLTTIVPNPTLPIPVLRSVRKERSTFLNMRGMTEGEAEINNNLMDEASAPSLLCSMCVDNTKLGEEALRRHLKNHYDAMFKCGVCRQNESPSS